MLCYILDDQYGKKIYDWIEGQVDAIFPIRDNIMNPLEYIDDIMKHQPDYILLDNYFPNRTSWREEPLWNEFLERINNTNLSSKIICISDYGERLVNEYDARREWYEQGKITDFISSKDPKDLIKVLRYLLN